MQSVKKKMQKAVSKNIFFLLLAVLFCSGARSVSAATTIPYTYYYALTEDTTWSKAGSPYYVQPSNFSIDPGVTLTIEPGVTVIRAGVLYIGGTLNAIGTKEEPVTFTDQYDAGQTLSVGGTANLTHTKLENTVISSQLGIVNLNHATFDVKNGQSFGTLIGLRSATLTAENTTFQNANTGIQVQYTSEATIHNSTFQNISDYSIQNTPINGSPAMIDATNNYWGDPAGPELWSRTRPGSATITTNVNVTPFLTSAPGSGCQQDCFSNVLFLPGIMGSRLYEAGQELWFSGSTSSQLRMKMNTDGSSKYDVYTLPDIYREIGEIDETGLIDDTAGFNLYQSFLNDLRDWKTEGIYNDYAFIPYDWRLSLNDIIMNGQVVDGKLRYTNNNTSLAGSFLYQQTKALQESSKSGKVTLIGHSNGGLVIKAFVEKLRTTNDPLYHQIDKIILVATPQLGTPDAVVSMLYGSRIGLPLYGVAPETGRTLSQYMPPMYNLLPTDALATNLGTIVEFEGDGIPASWREKYGTTINSPEELSDFLTGEEGRTQPQDDETEKPLILSGTLLNAAKSTHQSLDNWVPAPETQVVQIAGWGMYTVNGLQLKTVKHCPLYKDGPNVLCRALNETFSVKEKLTYRGDATVIAESALAMNEGPQAKQWWVDLHEYNKDLVGTVLQDYLGKIHKDILEVDTLRPFIKCLIENTTCDNSSDYISATEPAPLNTALTKYSLHSPLYLTVTDAHGNITGYNPATGEIEENIPRSQYFEVGEVKTVILPEGITHRVTLKAYDKGSFTFSAEKVVGDNVVETTEFEAIPTLEDSEVEVTQSAGKYTLQIDFDDDGVTDKEVEVEEGGTIDYLGVASPDTPRFYFSIESKSLIFKNADHNKEAKTITYTKDNKDYVLSYTLHEESKTRLTITFTELRENGVLRPDFQPVSISFRSDQKKKSRTNLDITATKGKQKLSVDYQQKGNKTVVKNWQKKKVTSKKTYKGIVTTHFYLHNEGILWGTSK